MMLVQQVRVLTLKNFWLVKRERAATFIKLITPFICMGVCYLLTAKIWEQSYPEANQIDGIPKCKQPCTTLMFWPNTSEVITLMRYLADNNSPRLVFGRDVVPTTIGNAMAFRNSVFNQNLSVQGGVFFTVAELRNSSTTNISYTIIYDYINNYRLNMQTAVDQAIVKYVVGGSMEVSLKNYPGSITYPPNSSNAVVQAITCVPLFIALTFLLFPVMSAIGSEKEKNLYKYMKCFGLKSSAYWLSWSITYLAQHMIVSIILLAIGYIIPGLLIFTNCNIVVHLLNFFAYGVGLVGFLSFLSMFISGAFGANIAAATVFFLGLGGALTTALLGTFIYGWWGPDMPFVAKFFLYLAYTTPMFPFAVVNITIAAKAAGAATFSSIPITKFKWTDLTAAPYPHVPTPLASILTNMLLGLLYFSLALLVDHFVSGSQGTLISNIKHCLTRSKNRSTEELRSLNAEVPQALTVTNLSKTFSRGGKRALHNVNLNANEGCVLVLLGPNGAGKTTIVNILCGLESLTGGRAYINGHNIETDIDIIRSSLGVCLQNDVYWDILTAWEHLYIFCCLKASVSRVYVEEEIANKLSEVQLTKVGDKEVSTYSGGMRRRLSLAISMIGDPEVVLLDEPTTGIDVINQKYVWNIISERKRKAKLIVIVTHSHEEALHSGDRIVILVDGKIKHEGTPQDIKRLMGDSNSLNVLVDVSNSKEIKATIARILPDATVMTENAGSIVYSVPKASDQHHTRNELFSFLQQEQNIKDWKFSTSAQNFLLK